MSLPVSERLNKKQTRVFCHAELDKLRKDQTLCNQCEIKPNCLIIKQLYEITDRHDTRFITTACPRYTKILEKEGGV
jgi:hypothetical protein